MALNGVYSEKICNGYITLLVEWRVEQDILNSTNTYHYDIYVDTSACASAKYDGDEILIRATGISVRERVDFKLSRLDATGKIKVGTVSTAPVSVGENDIEIKIQLSTGDFYAYTDLITYVKDDAENEYQYFTVSGITRTTIGDVYGDCVLGNEQTLTADRKRTEFTHKISWKCGTESGLICNNSTDETFKFTLPVDLAAQETEKTTLSVEFTLTTYYGETVIGTRSKTFTFTMPESVAPSCTLSVSDAESYTDTYGGYVQRQSRLYINVTPAIAYDSPIVKYEISANGAIYDIETNTVTTALLKTSGKQTVSVVITDRRGRTGTAEVEIDVIPWMKPDVIKLNTFRTDENGNDDGSGEYITAHFDVSVSPLNNLNSATYILAWKKVSGLDQNRATLSDYAGMYSVTDGTYTFKADKGTAYEVTLYVTDDFETGELSRGGSNAVVLMHFGSDGESMAIGGYATLRGVLDVFFKLYPRGGFIHPKLSSINETTPNTYYCENPQDLNLPSRLAAVVKDPFVFDVIPISDNGGNVMQRITTCPSDVNEVPLILVRSLQGSSWKPWFNTVSGADYA